MAFRWVRYVRNATQQKIMCVEIRTTHVVERDDMINAMIWEHESAIYAAERNTETVATLATHLPTLTAKMIESTVREYVKNHGSNGGNYAADGFKASTYDAAYGWAREQIRAAWPDVDWSV